jgi:hypothetical protein
MLVGVLALAGCSGNASNPSGGDDTGGSTEVSAKAAELQSALDAMRADPANEDNYSAVEFQLVIDQQQLACAPGHEGCDILDQFTSLDADTLAVSPPADGVCLLGQGATCTDGQVLASNSSGYSESAVASKIYQLVAHELGIESSESLPFLASGNEAACVEPCAWDTTNGWHVEMIARGSADGESVDFSASFSPAAQIPSSAATVDSTRAALRTAAQAAKDAITADDRVKTWTVSCPSWAPDCTVGDFFVQDYPAQTWLMLDTGWCVEACSIESPDGPVKADATTDALLQAAAQSINEALGCPELDLTLTGEEAEFPEELCRLSAGGEIKVTWRSDNPGLHVWYAGGTLGATPIPTPA